VAANDRPIAQPVSGEERREPTGRDTISPMQQLVQFFRENPQVLVLAIVCLVLGIGTFLIVIFGLISAGTTRVTGEPSGVIALSMLAM
jgi:hypothetical protein